jgi:hypothetical protein
MRLIFFLISFLVQLLLHGKATDSCMLTLYPATLPKVFIMSSFLVEYLGSFKQIRLYPLQIEVT